MRLALAQIDTIVGDLDGNRDLILARLDEARGAGADLVLFPELAVTGYPPEDLLLRPGFVAAAARSLEEIAGHARDVVALVGFPHLGNDLYNACAVCANGAVQAIYRKRFLPNYGVFDEDRYFAPGRDLVSLDLGGTLVGVTICEDMWQPGPPATDLALAGAELPRERQRVAVPRRQGGRARGDVRHARPRQRLLRRVLQRRRRTGRADLRRSLVRARRRGCRRRAGVGIPGGAARRRPRAEGRDRAAAARRAPAARSHANERQAPQVQVVHVGDVRASGSNGNRLDGTVAAFEPELEQMRLALELGLRDYVQKNGFEELVVGVSGGIDSAVTAALASEALGAERVHCVSMPSRYSSEGTRTDARRLAESLRCDFREVTIEPMYEAYMEALRGEFEGRDADLTRRTSRRASAERS
jgi:NAD+ synthase (glutamine-hydrolysing)